MGVEAPIMSMRPSSTIDLIARVASGQSCISSTNSRDSPFSTRYPGNLDASSEVMESISCEAKILRSDGSFLMSSFR